VTGLDVATSIVQITQHGVPGPLGGLEVRPGETD
jgi:hypothetical protein